MNARDILAPILLAASVLFGAPLGSADTTDEAIRSAVRKSLPLLAKTGPIFFEKSACVSCHNISLPSLAMVLAGKRGFEVNEQARRKNIESAISSHALFDTRRMMALDAVPGESMTTGYTLWALAAEDYAGNAWTDSLASWTAEAQLTDGSWSLTAHRPPIEYSSFTGTALGLRAIQLYGPPAKQTALAVNVDRARAWLERNVPPDNEGRTFRLLGMVWAGSQRSVVRQAVDELIRTQKDDGGWAQLPGLESDAYASGQALYALKTAGMAASEATYRKGIEYLLGTQLADGTWLVKTRSRPVQPYFESGFPHGPDQWISCAATSWATMALTLALDGDLDFPDR